MDNCPDGYTEGSSNDCVPFQFCTAECATCNVPNDVTSVCATCPSSMSNLAYNTLSTPGPCVLTTNNNAQHLITVNKDTELVTSALQSVTFNGATQSTSGDTLGTVNLYKQNVIEFMTLTSSSVVFNFNIAQTHKKILVRARIFT